MNFLLDKKSLFNLQVRGESVCFLANCMYIDDMIVSEKISQKVEKLPIEIQLEVLDFVEFMTQKAQRQNSSEENREWSQFSLNQAMKGLEDEEITEYDEADLKEKWR